MRLGSGKQSGAEGFVGPGRAAPTWRWLLGGLWLAGYVGWTQPLRIDSVVVIDASGVPVVHRRPTALSLPAQQNYLTIYCSAPVATPMQYRLLGLDEGWTTGHSPDQLHYANLNGGRYTFQLRPAAGVAEGVAGGGALVELPVQIEMPFWRRVWFWPLVALYVLGVLGVLMFLFLRYRFLQKLRYLQARDRIARDLHDDMGSYLSSISILSASARRNALLHPERTQAALDKIGQTARQMLDTMGDIVWSINPTHDSMTHVIDRMADVGNALFANTDVEFTMQVGEGVGTFPLATEARRDFFLIYKEAVTNAARYAGASRVRVSLRRENDHLLLTVQDDGRGFDPANPLRQNPGGGNGLGNLRTRAGQLGGDVSVVSAPGDGAVVTLRVPLP